MCCAIRPATKPQPDTGYQGEVRRAIYGSPFSFAPIASPLAAPARLTSLPVHGLMAEIICAPNTPAPDGRLAARIETAGVEPAPARAADEAAQTPEFSRVYLLWLLTVLLLVNALNLADRQGLAVSAPAIKHDLMLSDTQLGLLQGLGFAIFFSLLALPIARLAEHKSRTRIIAISVGVLGVMLSLCGTAKNFWQFLLFRIGVGVGDAGFGPPVASLTGDHYPTDKRASVNSIIWLGAPVGAVVGSVLGGWCAQNLGWRVWFYGLGVPAAPLAAASRATTSPTRKPRIPMATRVQPDLASQAA